MRKKRRRTRRKKERKDLSLQLCDRDLREAPLEELKVRLLLLFVACGDADEELDLR